ncbi:MAG: hypothetical protein FWE27_07820 [Defluviitaleaceae bacterium]|nr:hypothetical protein [Defluviitaleaceae bacterium]
MIARKNIGKIFVLAVALVFALAAGGKYIATTNATQEFHEILVATYGELQTQVTFTSDAAIKITLAGNINGTTGLIIENDFTLDLNGYTLNIDLPNATGRNANGITLSDDATLTVMDSSENEVGSLTVINRSTDSTVGFGAAISTTDGTLIIQNGTVTATGGNRGAGIGGGFGRSGGTAIINGGTVTAAGGSNAAGIGGGGDNWLNWVDGGGSGTITINGGTITATAGSFDGDSRAIGRGNRGNIFGTISIETPFYQYWANTTSQAPGTQGTIFPIPFAEYKYVRIVQIQHPTDPQDILRVAALDGGEFKLEQDINGTSLIIANDFILDLNGYALNIDLNNTSGRISNGITITNSVTFTIMDSSENETGSLTVINRSTDSTVGFGAAISTTDGTLIINSGTVTATGGNRGTGIGGGFGRSNGTVIINGGTITAAGGSGAAGIGGGGDNWMNWVDGGGSGTITINGGNITATAGSSDGDSRAIGRGNRGNIFGEINITMPFYQYWANTTNVAPGTPGAIFSIPFAEYKYVRIVQILQPTDPQDILRAAALAGGEYKLEQDINGTALIIGKDFALDLNGYALNIDLNNTSGRVSNGIAITNDATFTITDSSEDETGKLTVINRSTDSNVGFGAAISTTDGTLIIQNGNVTATGGNRGAGIGGGFGRSNGTVITNGGTITAAGGSGAAGIGGGGDNWMSWVDGGGSGTVTINGGNITATAGSSDGDSRAIGRGNRGNIFGEINITMPFYQYWANTTNTAPGTPGTIFPMTFSDYKYVRIEQTQPSTNPTDLLRAAALAGGEYKLEQAITINGTVNGASLIVGSNFTFDLNGYALNIDLNSIAGRISNGITITNGATFTILDSSENKTGSLTVINRSTDSTIGFGAAINTANGTLIIQSGTVTATGGQYGAGIGGGMGLPGGTVTINGGTVAATGGHYAAGIGGGGGGLLNWNWVEGVNGGTVTINGGTVTATAGSGDNDWRTNIAIGRGNWGEDDGTLDIAMPHYQYWANTTNQAPGIQGEVFPIPFPDYKYIRIEQTQPSTTPVDLLRAAALAGGEYKLEQAITINSTRNGASLIIGKNFTLDLNGYTLNIDLSEATGRTANGITISNEAVFTVSDSSENKTGKLTVVNGSTDTMVGFGAAISTTNGTFIIQSGAITATSGQYGAGIGGGMGRSNGTVIINGGTITAAGGSEAAGIGGGGGGLIDWTFIDGGGVGTVTINGGTVTAVAGSLGCDSRAIGRGNRGDFLGTVTITTPFYQHWANTTTYAPGTQGTIFPIPFAELKYIRIEPSQTKNPLDSLRDTALAGGEYKLEQPLTINNAYNGASLIIGKDFTLDLNGYALNINLSNLTGGGSANGITITNNATFTVTDSSENETGSLSVINNATSSGEGFGAAISTTDGTLIIQNGTVTAQGGYMAASIGGGVWRSNGMVIINGGTVTAERGAFVAGLFGAGIGGGSYGDGGTVIINGGTVRAEGGFNASGIGGGDRGNGGAVTINGGTVTAVALADGTGAAGGGRAIGGGGVGMFDEEKENGTINITIPHYQYWTNTANTAPGTQGNTFPMQFPDDEIFRYVKIAQAVPVSITTSANNPAYGTVTSSVSLAAQGKLVHVTAIPSIGYVFDSWEVLSDNSTLVSIDLNSEIFTKNATFITPHDAVSIRANFVPIMINDLEKELRIAAQTGGKYLLPANITINEALYNVGFSVENNFILDLNGYSSTIDLPDLQGMNANGISIASGMTFTIIDSSAGTTGSLDVINRSTNSTIGYGAAIETTNATLIIQSGTVTVTGGHHGAGIGGASGGAGGTVIMEGGIITVESSCDTTKAVGGGNGNTDDGTIIVTIPYYQYWASAHGAANATEKGAVFPIPISDNFYRFIKIMEAAAPATTIEKLRHGLATRVSSYTLTEDITINDVYGIEEHSAGLVITKDITLDLNGFNLEIDLPALIGGTSNGIKILSGAALTISDSKHSGTLTITNGSSNPVTEFGAAINTDDGSIIFDIPNYQYWTSTDNTGPGTTDTVYPPVLSDVKLIRIKVGPMPELPTVTNGISDNISMTRATVYGNIIADGGGHIRSYGFYYGIAGEELIKVTAGTDNRTGSFSHTLTELSYSSDYIYKFFAVNGCGESVSDELSFSTPGGYHWNTSRALTANLPGFNFASVHEIDGNLLIGDFVTLYSEGVSHVVIRVNGTLTLGRNACIVVRNGFYANAPTVSPFSVNQSTISSLASFTGDGYELYPGIYGRGGDGGRGGIGFNGTTRRVNLGFGEFYWEGGDGGDGGDGGGGGFGGGTGGAGGARGNGATADINGIHGFAGSSGWNNGGNGGGSNRGGAGGGATGIGERGLTGSTDWRSGGGGGGNGGTGGFGIMGRQSNDGNSGGGGGGGGYGGGILTIVAKEIVYDDTSRILVSGQQGGNGGGSSGAPGLAGRNGDGGIIIINSPTQLPLSIYNAGGETGIHRSGHGVITGTPARVFTNINEVDWDTVTNYTVTFNSGEAATFKHPDNITNPREKTIGVGINGERRINNLPRMNEMNADGNVHRFGGWRDENTNKFLRDGDLITGDMTVTAVWVTVASLNENRENQFLLGDANDDGRLTSADATAIAKWLIAPDDLKDPNFCEFSADITGKGYVTVEDITMLARLLVGLDVFSALN